MIETDSLKIELPYYILINPGKSELGFPSLATNQPGGMEVGAPAAPDTLITPGYALHHQVIC